MEGGGRGGGRKGRGEGGGRGGGRWGGVGERMGRGRKDKQGKVKEGERGRGKIE